MFFLTDYTLRWVTLGSAVLGIVSGALGALVVLRRQSLLGDAISHAALPGIALAFLLTRSRTPITLVLGAAVAGWLAALLVMGIIRGTRIKYDSGLGLVTFVFFGFGLVLLTYIQKNISDAGQAGLDRFLFGQAAALFREDVAFMALLGGITLFLLALFWKEFKLLCFDIDFGASLGFPMRLLDLLLTSLVVVAIVIGLQAVGVVLMSALIVAPAAAARQWTNRLSTMVVLSATFGALSGMAGALISSQADHVPTGPMIVLCAGVLVLISLLLAPERGILWEVVRRWYRRHQLRLTGVLEDLYVLDRQHEDPDHGHAIAVLEAMSGNRGGTTVTLRELASRGWARETSPDTWTLTPAGRAEAAMRLSLDFSSSEEEPPLGRVDSPPTAP